MKRLLALMLIFGTFSSCDGVTATKAENAGKALAEMNCAIISGNATITTDETYMNEAIAGNGFENYEEFKAYLDSIEGTEEQNEVAVSVRTNLQEICPDELEALGINAADLSESVMSQ